MGKTTKNKVYVIVDRTLQDVIAVFKSKKKALLCAYRYAKHYEWNYDTKIENNIGYTKEGRYNFLNGGIVEVLERDVVTRTKDFEFQLPDDFL